MTGRAADSQTTASPVTSMSDWSVGLDDKGRPTVTICLNEAEAKLWAVWLMEKCDEVTDAL